MNAKRKAAPGAKTEAALKVYLVDHHIAAPILAQLFSWAIVRLALWSQLGRAL